MKNYLLLLGVLFLLSGCKNKTEAHKNSSTPKKTSVQTPKTPAEKVAFKAARAHHEKNFTSQKAIAFTLEVKQNNGTKFQANISFLTDLSKIKVTKNDGTTLIHNQGESAYFPKDKNYKNAKRDLWIWATIFSLPFKLNDPARTWNHKST